MGALTQITTAEKWRSAPVQTAGAALLCALTFPVCLAQEMGERAGTAARDANADAMGALAGAYATGSANVHETITDLGTQGAAVLDASGRPLEAVAQTAMYIAIAVVALVVALLAGVAWWILK